MDNSILIRAGMFDDLLRALRRCHAALETHPGGDNRDDADRIHTATTLALAEAEAHSVSVNWTPPEKARVCTAPATPEALLDADTLPAFLRRQA